MKLGNIRGRILLFALLAAAALAVFAESAPAFAVGNGETSYIVKYREDAVRLLEDSGVPFDVVPASDLRRLARSGVLEWYEPDGEGILLGEPAMLMDSSYYESAQWNLDMVNAEGAFAKGALGQGVRVGIVDSGVSPHEDFGKRLLTGKNYMEDAADATDTADRFGHGTQVAGLIAGSGEAGYIGTAPGAELVPLKITDGKSVKVSAICRAIYGGIDDFGCDVLNLSLGVKSEYQSLKEAVEYAEAKGVTVVSAVGNSGGTTLYYPAGYESVIGVGSVDRKGDLSSSSNRNASVFLTAPGVSVRSTARTGGYVTCSGTSFSVGQVSGAAAVLIGQNSALSPADVRLLFAKTAADRGDNGFDEKYGYGILNVTGASSALEAGGWNEPEWICSFLPEDGPASQIRNHTDLPVAGTYLLAEYDASGRCLSVVSHEVQVPAFGTADVAIPGVDGYFRQFFCEEGTLKPLAEARMTQDE
ncbi:MAG: S8 family serine peptidase [Clostridia bacterium]|nr:S8 family serine peptidase [Clostridia bacterium]